MSELLERPRAKHLDSILGKKFPVLDDGFIRLIDYMGDDAAVVQAARVSYGKGTKKVNEDEGLIRYLMRHNHCYHPSMQVLTSTGWRKWSELGDVESFVVPNPDTKELTVEVLPVKKFSNSNENMFTFRNNRMSYSVTSKHKMWFKGKYQKEYHKVEVGEMSKWGHFEGISGFSLSKNQFDPYRYYEARLAGFFLGDGYKGSTNRIVFRLKKDRKIEFLEETLQYLDIDYKKVKDIDGVSCFYIDCEGIISSFGIDCNLRARHKSFSLNELTSDIVDGLFDGLVNSDGSYKKDRPQINFSSTSKKLSVGFELLCALKGVDAHFVSCNLTEKDELYRVSAHIGSRTSLESRPQYHDTEAYSGEVFCTTTSTGLLLVRGSEDSFAFISSNSTPFEMCELKVHIRIPMDAWRQMIRHRMASVNEYSTRYSEAINANQKTPPLEWRLQSGSNKQGSDGCVEEYPDGYYLSTREEEFHRLSRELYEERLAFGVAREQARKDLPLSTYTEAYWKIDLKNLLHFLALRMDSHAQKEIRDYANVIGNEIVANWVPLVWQAFNDYHPLKDAMQLSFRDREVIQGMKAGTACAHAASFGWLVRSKKTGKLKDNRERKECEEKLRLLNLPIPWAL